MSQSDINIRYWTYIGQKTDIGFYQLASKTCNISILIETLFLFKMFFNLLVNFTWVSCLHIFCCWLLAPVLVVILNQAFNNILLYKLSNKKLVWFMLLSANIWDFRQMFSNISVLADIFVTLMSNWDIPTSDMISESFGTFCCTKEKKCSILFN